MGWQQQQQHGGRMLAPCRIDQILLLYFAMPLIICIVKVYVSMSCTY